MSNVMLGKVVGDTCPNCKSALDVEGEFYEGQEYDCPECGIELEFAKVEATYTVTMRPLLGAKRSKCVECDKWKEDPEEFYDGLRCKVCCEEDEKKEALKGKRSTRKRARA